MQPSQIHEIIKKVKDKKLQFAVAVEGGGLRGLVSASMLDSLKDFGLEDQITSMSGTSSGAINGSYFLANQMEDLFSLYKKMASKDFIQPLKFPDAMNLDFLFNEQIPFHHPLQSENITQKYYVTVSSVLTGKSKALLASGRNHEDFLQLLRASSSAPLYTTNTEKIEGEEFTDGHIGLAIPYEPLLEEKVDFVFCLMTQKKNYQKKSSLFSKFHQWLALRKYSELFRTNFRESFDLYNQQLDFIYQHPRIVPIQIEEDDFIISKMCTQPEEVDHCRESVKKRMVKLFT